MELAHGIADVSSGPIPWFGPLPGAAVSLRFLPSMGGPNPCGLNTQGASIDSLQGASLAQPVLYQQAFGNA